MSLLSQNPGRKKQLILCGGIALFFSLVLALSAYLLFFQTPTLARREYAFALLLWFIFIPLVYFLLTQFLLPRLLGYSPIARRNWFLLSIGICILFTLIIRPPQIIPLLPVHQFQITVPAGHSDRTISLEYAKTSLRDIGFGELKQEGNWQRTEVGLTHNGSEPASLSWSGRTGDSATLLFRLSQKANGTFLEWDSSRSTLEPSITSGGKTSFTSNFPIDTSNGVLARLCVGFTAGFLFLVITLFLLDVQLKPAPSIKRVKGYWLLYTLPMIAVWGIYLLSFWPGMMSPDSNNQWAQAVSGQFNDAHPVFHTLLLWVLMRIWYSPASVVIFQIITLSLTTAWGISIIEEQGLPRWATWSIALLFSLAPMNGNMVVILWKDIPYSTSLFLFSLLILKVALTKGAWLNGKLSWVWLGLVSICVAGFRHNGLPIPIIMLPVLIIAYRKYWKPLLKCIAFFLIIFSLYRYPVMDLLHAERSSDNEQFLYIHHIAAHIVTGGKLTESEKQMADAILPLEDWKYACCDRLATFRSNGFSDMRIPQNASGIQALFIKLVIKEPLIEIKHILCSGSIVWEIPNRCGPNTLLPYTDVLWIDPGGAFFIENSQIPILKGTLNSVHNALSTNDGLALFISPAIYLLLSVYSTSILAARKKDLRCMLFVFPAILQSIIIFLTSPTSQFRYQFAVYLLGLFSVGLLILALITPVRISHFEDKPIIKND